MTHLERSLRSTVLRALGAARGNPLARERLKAGVRDVYPEVAFTEAELEQILDGLVKDGQVQATDEHPVFGPMLALTLRGTATVKQLG